MSSDTVAVRVYTKTDTEFLQSRIRDLEKEIKYLKKKNKAMETAYVAEIKLLNGKFAEDRPLGKEIIDSVCKAYDVQKWELLSDRRWHHIIVPRQHAMWLMRELTLMSFPQIGRLFKRDHATVIFGCRAHEKRVEDESPLIRPVRVESAVWSE